MKRRSEDAAYDTTMPHRLTFILAGLMAVQSLLGLAASEQYRDAEWIKVTWFGNDWLTLVVAVPLLVFSTARAQSGSIRAFLLSVGSVGYAVYNYAFYLLGASVNVFFPLYVASVVLAAIVLILTLGRLDVASVAASLDPDGPVRILGGSLMVIGLGLASVWMVMWAGYVFAGRPTPVDPDVFRLVAALDLSLMVPALVSGGLLLWQRRPWGLVIAAIAGVQASLYLAVLSVNSLVAIARGLATSTGELLIWAPAFAVTLAVTSLLFSSVRTQRVGA